MGFIEPERAWLDEGPLARRIPEQAKCRFVLELVAQLDLSALYGAYSDQGGDAYDPATMLATWFFAYSEGLTSTRKLEAQCGRDLHYIYISGNLSPDHSSLSRFRKRHLPLMKAYFIELVHQARKKGYSSFKDIAIDGSVIQAKASKKKDKDSDSLARYRRAIEHQIDDYFAQCQREDRLLYLQRLKGLLEARAEQLATRKKTLKPEHRTAHKINLVEPEAINHKGRPGYNVQASVDVKTHLIVACDVVTDRNDRHQFMPQYTEVEATLGANLQRRYTLDSGYHSLENLSEIQSRNIDALLADPMPHHRAQAVDVPSQQVLLERDRPIERMHFCYDSEADCYHCPGGDRLAFQCTATHKGRPVRRYQAQACAGCPLKHLCLSSRNKKGVRTLLRDACESLAEAMGIRLQSEPAKARMKSRRESVEPVFGNLKSNMGFRRFRLGSLANVRAEFALMCIGHNINKLYSLATTFLTRLGQQSRVIFKEIQRTVLSRNRWSHQYAL